MSRADPLRIRDYLDHIAEAIANIRDYTDHGIVWRTIGTDLPALDKTIQAALSSLPV